MLRVSMIAIACCVIAVGCGNPPPQKTPDDVATTEPQPETPDVVATTEMPPMPAWAEQFIGKAVADAFPGEGETCLGFVDKIADRFGGVTSGVAVVGWGWSTSGAQAYERFVAVDQEGIIQGGGEGGVERGDVQIAIPVVKETKVGYSVLSKQSVGRIRVFGISSDTACQLGPELPL